MGRVQHIDFAHFGSDDSGILIEGDCTLGSLATDIDVQQVTGMDGGLISVHNGLGTVTLCVGEVGHLSDRPAGGDQEGEGEKVWEDFHGGWILAVSWWLLAVGCWPLAVRWWLLAVGSRWSLTILALGRVQVGLGLCSRLGIVGGWRLAVYFLYMEVFRTVCSLLSCRSNFSNGKIIASYCSWVIYFTLRAILN